MDLDFEVPIALSSSGKHVLPHEGVSGAPYLCVACKGGVVWRTESQREGLLVRRPHFAHTGLGCGLESREHYFAKHLATRILKDWRAGLVPAPVLLSKCKKCRKERGFAMPEPTEDPVCEDERRVVLASGRVPDVWCGFALEIHRSHAVDDEKLRDLSADGVECVEVEAAPLLKTVPRWEATRPHEWKRCIRCVEARTEDLLAQMTATQKIAAQKASQIIDEAKGRLADLDLAIEWQPHEQRMSVLTSATVTEVVQQVRRLHDKIEYDNWRDILMSCPIDCLVRELRSSRRFGNEPNERSNPLAKALDGYMEATGIGNEGTEAYAKWVAAGRP